MMDAKICTRCEQEKPCSEFGAHKDAPDGLAWWCNQCYKDHAKETGHAATMRWREKNREHWNETRRARHRRLRLEAIAAYGGKCSCCGEDEEAFLSLEHIGGLTDADKRANGKRLSSTDMYLLVKREGYPDRFTILCMNCNHARSRLGYCPHEAAVLKAVV